MTKNNTLTLKHVIIMAMFLLTISCNITPEMAEPVSTASMPDKSVGNFPGPVFSVPITLDRVKIFTSGSNTVTGNVIVEIANSNGSVVLGSAALPGSSMTGSGQWRTFYFAPITLMSGTKYRLQVRRTDEPDYTNNFMHWGASDGSIDAYPKGGTSITGTHPPYDMAFITYSGGYVDQQQTAHTHFWGIGKYVSWQEFVPEKIWVIQP
jgi:hypothetical protein